MIRTSQSTFKAVLIAVFMSNELQTKCKSCFGGPTMILHALWKKKLFLFFKKAVWRTSTPRPSPSGLSPSPTRRSRDVLGLGREWRQVQRGAAEVYLSSVRVNIAEESVMDHRVQLQCKVYEEGGKYTKAQPRCTCPSYESTLHTSRWSPCPVTDGLNVS